MIYARSFFDLQLAFAERVAALSGLPLARTLLDFTKLYIRFGLGRAFDPAHPTWRAYLDGLQCHDDPREWTYRFSLKEPGVTEAPGVVATFGCFSYAPLDSWVPHRNQPDHRQRLHRVRSRLLETRITGPTR